MVTGGFPALSAHVVVAAALVADGLHARADGFTSLAVVLGAAGVALGFPAADPIAGLLITVLILFVLKDAARDVLMRIMDGVDPAILDASEVALRTVSGVESVGEVRIRWIGHKLHAEAEVLVNESLSVVAAHEIAERARHSLLHEVPHLASAIIHADPCGHGGEDHHADLAHPGPAVTVGADRPSAATASGPATRQSGTQFGHRVQRASALERHEPPAVAGVNAVSSAT
ncbi:MAG: hypothetical protein NVS9B8_04110 [Candidatus Limnocylindrales bacterium]